MFTKRVKIDIWVNDTSNQLLVRGSYCQITFSKIQRAVLVKLSSPWQANFVFPHQSVSLTLAFKRALQYGNVAITIVILTTKNSSSNFLKKVLVFQKTYFKVKVFKTFKISGDCLIKTCQSLKRRTISKISITIFQRNLKSFCQL